MNKSSVVSLSLPVTSAILVYNFGFISSVEAQEKYLFDLDKFKLGSPFYLSNNNLEISHLTPYLSSLDSDLFSNYNIRDNISFLSFKNEYTDLLLAPQFTTTVDLGSIAVQSKNNILDIQSATLANNNTESELKSDAARSSVTWMQAPSAAKTRTWGRNLFPPFKSSASSWGSHAAKAFVPGATQSLSAQSCSAALAHTRRSRSDRSTLNNSSGVLTENSINQTLNQIEQYNLPDLAFESFNKVSNLKDVQPTDWAYNSLIRLIERHGCFSGFEDNTFRGDRALTRYEFAAALSSCLQSIETLATEDETTIAEFTQLQKLQTEFQQELAAVQSNTDDLERRVAVVEEQNFSPTTILRGQAEFLLASVSGDQKAVPSGETPTEDLLEEVTFSSRVQLNFETSFTGRDLLRTRIEAGNINAFGSGVTGTQMTFLGSSTSTDNNFRIGQVFYRFPVGEAGNAFIAGARQSASAFIPTLNRASTISLFGFNNPLYDLGFGAGGGVYYQFSDLIGAGATYYSGSPSNSEEGKGFFNGDFSALGQITITPNESFGFSLTYARFFSPQPGSTNNVTGFTGSQFAQLPFGENTATASNNFNLALSYQVNEYLELGGWLGYIDATAKSSPTDSGFIGFEDANADIWTGAFTASYNGLGKLGSKLSFIVGVPPKLTSNDLPDRQDDDTSLHLELSYNYPLTEKIFLKSGVLAITNPEHNSDNDSIVVGLLQTTFSF
ncbi:MAG: iron uptake porin [Cyanobacteria bacterium P01_G01_bin.39]